MTLQPDLSSAAENIDSLASSFSASYAGVVAFIAVASEGSFAKAGDRLGIGRSAVSRSVQKLEQQLDTRLFLRTTRSTSLTREGELFYENCNPGVSRIIQALEDMRDLREGPPRGRLRVTSAVGFGRRIVAPLLKGFRERYPDILVELLLDDRPTDFASERVDVAFRDGRIEDSQIVAKQLIPRQQVLCASPEYFRHHGLPARIEDLSRHSCIAFRTASGRIAQWDFKVNGHPQVLSPSAAYTFNDSELVLRAALDGQGIAQLAAYQASDPLRSGQLLPCLGQYAPDEGGHYISYLTRQQLPSRIRVFIDYMTSRIRALDLELVPGFSGQAAATRPLCLDKAAVGTGEGEARIMIGA